VENLLREEAQEPRALPEEAAARGASTAVAVDGSDERLRAMAAACSGSRKAVAAAAG
jgi:hypothetical protein